ncbi:MAG: hypothetical protein ACOYNP_02850 [Gemmataceae bacterium]|jgi:hypothetical protein|nr:hypothetical protein [Planctomycetota bacterium]
MFSFFVMTVLSSSTLVVNGSSANTCPNGNCPNAAPVAHVAKPAAESTCTTGNCPKSQPRPFQLFKKKR